MVIQDSANRSEATVFRAHALPPGAGENPACAPKLLANQTGGESLLYIFFDALQEQVGNHD